MKGSDPWGGLTPIRNDFEEAKVSVEEGIIKREVSTSEDGTTLQRRISWTGAFWVASGVPALVLFTIGAIAATVGKPSWIVWAVSICFGFLQSFTYAEIAGLFPNKSGGASVYGAIAWVRYSKLVAPVSVWCNWMAWSPVLAIGSGLAAGYILNALFAPDALINTWQITLLDLGLLKQGLSLRINSTFLLGLALLLVIFKVQNGGILGSSKATMLLGIAGLVPLLLIGFVPLFTGDMPKVHFWPLLPMTHDAVGNVVDGSWNMAGWTLIAGGMFIAGWSTYGFETAVCYASEFKDPKKDTFRAIFYSGLLCLVVFTVVPLAFQGSLGLGELVTPAVLDAAGNITTPAVYSGMLAPDIYSGMGVAKAMSHMVGGARWIENVLVIMLVLALLLALMTSMSGSSRTLYQASVDGWLPKYLSHVNAHGAPTRAMWTNFVFNLLLLLMSDYVFVLAISNISYITFSFLNLNAGWIHRMDRPRWERPFKAPGWLLTMGAVLGFANLFFMGMGADTWGAGTLVIGLSCAALIVPIFVFRHYIQDKGQFPPAMMEDLHLSADGATSSAGIWPYVTLIAAATVIYVGHSLAVY